MGARRSDAELSRTLGRFLGEADRPALVRGDPVELVRRYHHPHDQEVAGFLVAMLAYGRVASIKAKAASALARLGPSPARAVDSGRGARALAGFVHRFQKGDDLPSFLRAVRALRRRHGSLACAFARHVRAGENHYAPAMGRFIGELEAALDGPPSGGLRFLLPQTEGGGAAKRLCLFLRWMIRPEDGVDLGAWRAMAPGLGADKLIIPLDTHIARISRNLGLTDRKSPDLKMALEITAALARLRPADPLAFDMALCHLGISGRCPTKRVTAICAECSIRAVCRLGRTPKGWPY